MTECDQKDAEHGSQSRFNHSCGSHHLRCYAIRNVLVQIVLELKHDLIIMKRRPYMLLRQLSLLWLWTLVVQIRFIVWTFNKNEGEMPMPMKYGLDIILMSPAFVFAAMFVGRLWVLFFSYLYSLNVN